MKDSALNREILRLAVPSILANITVPLVGMVDTAIAGHLSPSGDAGAAVFIGAITVGSMIFNLIYWNFSMLRTGTGGLTAQAFGRQDFHDAARILVRGSLLALIFAASMLLLQWPLCHFGLLMSDGSMEMERLAAQYFFIRVWAAPATVALMTFSGWFVGMQDSMSSMWKDLIVNIVNIAASLILTLGIGSWHGIGFAGIALGTVIAQYTGLAFCIAVCAIKYRKVLGSFRKSDLKGVLEPAELKGFMKMNLDLLGRSLCFTVIYLGYIIIATRYGDVILACSTIMMQLLMIFSYFTDGFAYAGEALTGRFIGAADRDMTRKTVKYVFIWAMSIAILFIGIYWISGVPLLKLMTSDAAVLEAGREYLPWLILMPPLGCAAFTWDGIYLGATATHSVFKAMVWAFIGFLAVWFLGIGLVDVLDIQLAPARYQAVALHILMGAYFMHLAARTVVLSLDYRKAVLGKLPAI